MKEVGEVFIDAFSRELTVWSKVVQGRLDEFISESVKLQSHSAFITTDGIEKIRNDVFADLTISDFVQSVSFRFFSFWGRSKEGIDELCALLALAATQPVYDDSDNSEVLLPDEYSERYKPEAEVFKLLKDNRWLVIVFLMRLFIEVRLDEIEDGDQPEAKT